MDTVDQLVRPMSGYNFVDQEALEQLEVLSTLQRWIDRCESDEAE